MSYQDSPFSTMYDRQDDYDLDEDNEEYLEEDRDAEEQDESDEGDSKDKLCTYMRSIFFACFYVIFGIITLIIIYIK